MSTASCGIAAVTEVSSFQTYLFIRVTFLRSEGIAIRAIIAAASERLMELSGWNVP